MGHLDQPENTFWQLFFRPPGVVSWSDQAQATATATNGGLVLATDGVVAASWGCGLPRTSRISPLIATSDGARSWSDGLVADRLAARPDALAANTNGQALALVAGPDGGQVLTTAGGISAWRTLATERQLAAGAGRSCGLGLLTAVGYVGGRAVIGGSCSCPGGVGLFAFRGGAWRAPSALPRSLFRGAAEVLALEPGQGRASALLAVAHGDRTSLVVARSTPERQWSTSPPLTLATNQDLASFGPGGRDRHFRPPQIDLGHGGPRRVEWPRRMAAVAVPPRRDKDGGFRDGPTRDRPGGERHRPDGRVSALDFRSVGQKPGHERPRPVRLLGMTLRGRMSRHRRLEGDTVIVACAEAREGFRPALTASSCRSPGPPWMLTSPFAGIVRL